MADIGAPMNADMMLTLIQKGMAKCGITIEDPFQKAGLYQEVKSNAASLILPFNKPVGGMTKGRGLRPAGMKRGDINWGTLKAEPNVFSKEFDVDRLIVTSDQAGVYAQLPEQFANIAKIVIPEEATRVLTDGFTTELSDIDGKAFFADDHVLAGSTVINNKMTDALTFDTYVTARNRLKHFYIQPDGDSRPQNLNQGAKLKLMVGPDLEVAAKKVVARQYLQYGEENVLNGDAEVVVNPYLVGTYANYWFLFASGGMSRSLLKWEREPYRLLTFNEKNSVEAARTAMWYYLLTWVGAVRPMFFHTVIGSAVAA